MTKKGEGKTVEKAAKKPATKKKTVQKKSENNLSLYANLAHKRQSKKDAAARKRAEYLAKLPKNPIKRLAYRLSPKRAAAFLFSRRGAKAVGKFAGISILVLFLFLAGLFAWFRKDLKQLRPEELAKRVQTTISKYYDRNGELLWEDKGQDDYRLVVEDDEIADIVKKATVAIEDRDFYKHKGIDLWAILRAVINNFKGGATQGGSTLTQQLVKQVFFSDEASERGIKGIPRKIKEMILAIEVERMYSKDQIISLYLNESPYGGRRNGIESGAQTYFGKSSKDLDLAEAALLAGIPNNPSIYNPYNIDYNEDLIERQHKVLNDMVEVGFITKEEADAAKKVNILDRIKPESDQYKDMKAPHFVQEVKKQLEEELGVKVVRSGGLTIKTTLDYEAQKIAEEAVAAGAEVQTYSGGDNIAMTAVDVETGQVIAQVGSVDYNTPGYGQTNSATSLLEPGSTIKPIIDYAPLFDNKEVAYGPGSVLRDENIDHIYCGGNTGSCQLRNFTKIFYGNITIRQSLGSSFNIAAVKALYITGFDKGLEVAQALGDKSYCADNDMAGLSAAIGGGCSVRQDEHANAYASLARGGVYKPLTYVTLVENAVGEKLKEWKDEPTQVIDKQAAYMVTDILADPNARAMGFGSMARDYGFVVPGVWTASKTGTTDDGNGNSKDSWMMSYSTAVSMGVWTGNHDGSAPAVLTNATARRVINNFMYGVHHEVYAKNGKWTSGDQIQRAEGVTDCRMTNGTDICPSWWGASSSSNYQTYSEVFDSISKKLATECTPESTKVTVTVTKTTDPITKKEVISAADGYNANDKDDVHKCSDTAPTVGGVSYSQHANSGSFRISGTINKGTHSISSITVSVDGRVVARPTSTSFEIDYNFTSTGQEVTVEVTDNAGYSDTKTYPGPTITQRPNSNSSSSNNENSDSADNADSQDGTQ